jgi:putative nucleotidyltransferase with HDIG domain
MRTVKNLAMVASTYPWMNKPLPGYGLGPSELWTNSFATAVGAQEVARLTRKAPDDVAFTAGLLHDLGKVALSIWLENKLQAIFHYAKRENIGFDEAERKVLGYDHAEVGEHLGHSWNLPEEICTVIRYHHHPSQSPESQAIVDCVHVGNWLALTMGFGVGGDGLLYEFDESSLFRLGINVSSLDEITDSFVTGFEQYEKLFKETVA